MMFWLADLDVPKTFTTLEDHDSWVRSGFLWRGTKTPQYVGLYSNLLSHWPKTV